MKGIPRNTLWNRAKSWSAFPAFILFLAFFILNIIITPNFLSLSFLNGFLAANTPLVVISIGVAVVIMAGGIDISLGGIVCLVNVLFALMIERGVPLGVTILAGLGIGIALGALNGFVVGILRVSPMLATFAASTIYAGLALWIMPLPGGMVPPAFSRLYTNALLGIPFPIYVIALVLILSILIRKSPLGTQIMASGQDEKKAYVSSVPVDRVRFFSYVFAGLCAGIAGIAMTANSGGGDARVGLALSLNSLAACVIGGVALSGGKGDTWGAMFGALFLQLVITTVLATQIPSFYQDFITGLILLVGTLGAVAVSKVTQKGRLAA